MSVCQRDRGTEGKRMQDGSYKIICYVHEGAPFFYFVRLLLLLLHCTLHCSYQNVYYFETNKRGKITSVFSHSFCLLNIVICVGVCGDAKNEHAGPCRDLLPDKCCTNDFITIQDYNICFTHVPLLRLARCVLSAS